MSRSDPQFKLRLPNTLKTLLEEYAERGRRTLTQEIVQRLERSIEHGETEFSMDPESKWALELLVRHQHRPRDKVVGACVDLVAARTAVAPGAQVSIGEVSKATCYVGPVRQAAILAAMAPALMHHDAQALAGVLLNSPDLWLESARNSPPPSSVDKTRQLLPDIVDFAYLEPLQERLMAIALDRQKESEPRPITRDELRKPKS